MSDQRKEKFEDELWIIEVWDLGGGLNENSIRPDEERQKIIDEMIDFTKFKDDPYLANGDLLEFFDIQIRPRDEEGLEDFVDHVKQRIDEINGNTVEMRLRTEKMRVFEYGNKKRMEFHGVHRDREIPRRFKGHRRYMDRDDDEDEEQQGEG